MDKRTPEQQPSVRTVAQALARLVRYHEDDEWREAGDERAHASTGGNVSFLQSLLWEAEWALQAAGASMVDGYPIPGPPSLRAMDAMGFDACDSGDAVAGAMADLRDDMSPRGRS